MPGIVAQQVALGRQVSFLDLHAALTPADLGSDGVHPTSSGYGKIADAWFPAIASVISPQGTSNPPVIVRTGTALDLTHVTVVFSKPLADSAANIANFSIPGLSISNATLDSATKRSITLTTSPQSPATIYSLSVSGVRDRTPQQTLISPGSMANFASLQLLENGSFEQVTGLIPDHWTVSGNHVIETSDTYPNRSSTDGTKMAAFNAFQLTPNAVFSQSFPTTPGKQYALQFDLGIYAFNTNTQRMQVTVSGNSQLLSQLETLTGDGNETAVWTPRTYTFIADSTNTTLSFADQSPTSDSIDMLLDNVRVGAPLDPTLAVTSSPPGGANMTISPADKAALADGPTALIRTYNQGTSVTVTAPSAIAGNGFLRWQSNGVDLPGSGQSITVTMNANQSLNAVYASGTAPIADHDSYSTIEGTLLTVAAPGVLIGDSDGESNPLSAILISNPAHGSLILNANGAFSYTPQSGFTGTDFFTYKASNGLQESNRRPSPSSSPPRDHRCLPMAASAWCSRFPDFRHPLQSLPIGQLDSVWNSAGFGQVPPNVPATDGQRMAIFNGANEVFDGTVSQSFQTIPGVTYRLQFDAGIIATVPSRQQILGVTVDGGTILSAEIPLTASTGGVTQWTPQSYAFTAAAATSTLASRTNPLP